MKDVLIIAHFSSTSINGNCRFSYIANMMIDQGYKVELVTSDFSHMTKSYKNSFVDMMYKITMLHETKYKRNVGLMRLVGHYVFGRNLKRYLKDRKKPDIIYCAVPSLDGAFHATNYAKKNKIKLIIDVQDLWPEAFGMVLSNSFISSFLFFPMKRKSKFIYKNADKVIAVSETYLEFVRKHRNPSEEDLSVYLGTSTSMFIETKENLQIDKDEKEFWIGYVGTLGHSYDLETVVDAIDILKKKGITNIKLIIMGNGPLEDYFKSYANRKRVQSIFFGRLPYDEMIQYLLKCDIAINPIKSKSAASIINKVGDYAAAGLPVINTQESSEYRSLLECYGAGLNCANEDALDIASKIELLFNNQDLRRSMGGNNKILAEDKFNREKTYKDIIVLLEN